MRVACLSPLVPLALAAALLLGPRPAAADSAYPTRAVRIIIPNPPGGGSDNIGRPLADQLSQTLGQPFVMESRTGGAGVIAVEALVRAPRDGYTLMLAVNAPLTILPHIRKVGFDPLADLVPVATLAETVAAVAVTNGLPVKTFREFIDYARANPSKVHYSSNGVGSVAHLRNEMLNRLGGLGMVHVPYKGDGEAIVDLISGTIEMAATSALLNVTRQGQARLVAFMATARHPEFPDIPTVREVLPGYDAPAWYGLFAATGTPAPVVARLNQAVNAILARPDIAERMLRSGNQAQPESVDAAAARLRKDFALYRQTVAEMDIKPEE